MQVVTTINYPTDTLKLLARAPDWQLVVVADKKTPEDWALENVIVLSIKKQEALKYAIMGLLPFNHYGYVSACRGLTPPCLLEIIGLPSCQVTEAITLHPLHVAKSGRLSSVEIFLHCKSKVLPGTLEHKTPDRQMKQ